MPLNSVKLFRKSLSYLLILIIVLLSDSCVCLKNAGQSSESEGNFPSLNDEPFLNGFSVYFTQPDNSSSGTFRGGPDLDLVKCIDGAKVSVDVALLKLNLWSVRDALIDANRRGISVRVVIDSDHMDEKEIQELTETGIPVLGDQRERLMHHKFVVVDRNDVWTGSMNLTLSDVYRNNNNLIHITSPDLAKNFTTEFEEMFIANRFGDESLANTPYPIVYVNGVRIENCFSPDDDCGSWIVSLIDNAQKSIYFLTFSFTSDEIANAMIRGAKRGVLISGVFDKSQYHQNQGTEFDKLDAAGLDVRLSENEHSMHHKVIIIDSRIVITGSYNFTYSAENWNDENLLIIYSPEIAGLYQEEYQKIYRLTNKKKP